MQIESIFGEGDPSAERKESVVTQQIKEERLPLFRQAGEQVGYRVDVLARAGETFMGRHIRRIDSNRSLEKLQDDYEAVTIKVDKGYVGISITNPDLSRDHTPFWDALQALDPSGTRY